ncbi:MAG: Tripartite tricarboxylate transporter family receptor [candidate division BRC1 bacterium ADurb.BinA364]|nr:MAG: Tripartite tricarboxylate transporter family receptor [candidate division BRC1 bacterium ADurb.BinA364]
MHCPRSRRRFAGIAVSCLAFAAASLAGCKQTVSDAAWPSRPIEISCFAAAGGGTDLIDRALAGAMGQILGASINVVNRTGGNGGVALNYVWSNPRDGYTWGGFSESIHPAPVMGAHHTTAKDWHWFMAAGAPDVISVGPNSPYKSLDDLIADAKARPGQVKAAASLSGSLHHAKLLALEKGAGVQFKMLPFKGSQPSNLAILSGEADVVFTSISEQAELLKDKKLIPLAMAEMEPYEFPGLGTIPAAGAQFPGLGELPVQQWLGFALPIDTPADILSKITDAFVKAMESPEIKQLAADTFLTLYGYHGEEAGRRAAEMESAWCWTLYDLGIAQKSPEEFGIPRPDDGEQ